MPVENTRSEQTSREDILPRKMVAAVRKRLGSKVRYKSSKIQEYYRPIAWVTCNQKAFTIKKASDKMSRKLLFSSQGDAHTR